MVTAGRSAEFIPPCWFGCKTEPLCNGARKLFRSISRLRLVLRNEHCPGGTEAVLGGFVCPQPNLFLKDLQNIFILSLRCFFLKVSNSSRRKAYRVQFPPRETCLREIQAGTDSTL